MNKFRNILTNDLKEANIVLYGVPFDCNCSVGVGAKFAPDKLRELSWFLPPYSMDGKPLNIKIFDKGNVPADNFDDIVKNANIFVDNKLKIIFGGDHSISIPFQKRFIKFCKTNNKSPIIVHIDAHCDICDEYFGSRFSHACTLRRALENGLAEKNLFMIGIREFEKDGYEYLLNRDNKVNLYTSSFVKSNGIKAVISDIKQKINLDTDLVYVSFDIDSLDCSFAPGTGTPETCGLSPFDLKLLLSELAKLKNLVCLDLVEIAPPLDVNDITSWCGIKLLYEFFANLSY